VETILYGPARAARAAKRAARVLLSKISLQDFRGTKYPALPADCSGAELARAMITTEVRSSTALRTSTHDKLIIYSRLYDEKTGHNFVTTTREARCSSRRMCDVRNIRTRLRAVIDSTCRGPGPHLLVESDRATTSRAGAPILHAERCAPSARSKAPPTSSSLPEALPARLMEVLLTKAWSSRSPSSAPRCRPRLVPPDPATASPTKSARPQLPGYGSCRQHVALRFRRL